MAIIKWQPFDELDRFIDEFPRITLPKMGWDLAVDVYEKNNTIIAQMNLPGIDSKNINVSVEGEYLHISGSREESEEEEKKQYYRKEIRRGSFERTVLLPHAVQKDKVTAEFKNGEITVTLPKIAGEKAGKINVKIKE